MCSPASAQPSRSGAFLSADVRRPDGRHHLRTDGNRCRGDRWAALTGGRGTVVGTMLGPLVSCRLPVGRLGDHRCLGLLANGFHRRRDRHRCSSQQLQIRPPLTSGVRHERTAAGGADHQLARQRKVLPIIGAMNSTTGVRQCLKRYACTLRGNGRHAAAVQHSLG